MVTASRRLVCILGLLKLDTTLLSSEIALVAVAVIRLVWLRCVGWGWSVGGVAGIRCSACIGRRAMSRWSPTKPSGATIWSYARSATTTSSNTAITPMSVPIEGGNLKT